MAPQSEEIVHHIAQKRRDIAEDVDRLEASLRTTYEEATNWPHLIRQNVPAAAAGLFALGLIVGLAVGNWTSR